MDMSRVIIVPKITSFEFDMARYGLGEKELLKKYEKGNFLKACAKIEAYQSHKEMVGLFREFFYENFYKQTKKNRFS